MDAENLICLILKHFQYQSENHYCSAPTGALAINLLTKSYDDLMNPKLDMDAILSDIKSNIRNEKEEMIEATYGDYDPLTMEISVNVLYKCENGSTYTQRQQLSYKKEYFK